MVQNLAPKSWGDSNPRDFVRSGVEEFPDLGACPLASHEVLAKIFKKKEKILGYDSSDLFKMPSSWQKNQLLPRNTSFYCL